MFGENPRARLGDVAVERIEICIKNFLRKIILKGEWNNKEVTSKEKRKNRERNVPRMSSKSALGNRHARVRC